MSADYPNSHDGVDRCVLFDADIEGYWRNYHCDHAIGFICEVVAGVEQPTTVEPPTDAPDINCHGDESDGWIQRPGETWIKSIQDLLYSFIWKTLKKDWFEVSSDLLTLHLEDPVMSQKKSPLV